MYGLQFVNFINAENPLTPQIRSQRFLCSKAVCAALGLEAQVPVLEENIRSAQEYKAKLEDMLNKAVQ